MISLLVKVALFAVIIGGQTPALADEISPQQWQQCQFQSLDQAVWTQEEETRTAWCVLNHWDVPGGFPKLNSVISCESGWYRLAQSDGGTYVGLGQHDRYSWDERVNTYEPVWWDLQPSWRNSRTQIVVTVRMARQQGWGPWGCD